MKQEFDVAAVFVRKAIEVDGNYAEAYYTLANAIAGIKGAPDDESCGYLDKSADLGYEPAKQVMVQFCGGQDH
jgi:hypothetical protein